MLVLYAGCYSFAAACAAGCADVSTHTETGGWTTIRGFDLVRKLLLRGYRVRALVRKRPDGSERELLPEKVEGEARGGRVPRGRNRSFPSIPPSTHAPRLAAVVYGDVSDYASVRSARRAGALLCQARWTLVL